MDVRFYPPPIQPPSAAEPSYPEPSPRFHPLYCNKFDRENMSELFQDFTSSQVYPASGLGYEDFNIPPITPPELTLPPPPESDPGAYHSQCPPVSHSRLNGLHPFHPHRMDPPRIDVSGTLSQDGGSAPSFLSAMLHKANSHSSQRGAYPQMEDFRPNIQSVMVQHGQLTTINQSQLSAHLGLSGHNVPHSSPSPPGSKRASPSPSSSVHEDETDEVLKGGGAEKRQATDVGKKPKVQKKKKKKDPNEPQKPVSAYALFFRDTQASIKGQNPSATFGDVSKLVASTWDGLGEEQKQLYKRKTEVAKTEYLKQLAAYRANMVSQSYGEMSGVMATHGSNSPVFPRSGQTNAGVYPGLSHPQQLRPTAPMPMPLPGANMASLNPLPRANMASLNPLPRANMSSQMSHPAANMATSMTLPRANMAASSPPPHPTMHQCATLQHQQQFVAMQKSLGNHHHQLPHGHHPQSIPQGFPPQAEFRGMLSGMSTAGLALTPPTDYNQSGCRDSSAQGLDWSLDYCSNGTLQR